MYNENSYSPLTLEDAMSNPHLAYSTGKAFAERAVWKFGEDNNPSVNTSDHRILAMVRGEMKHALEPTSKIGTFVVADHFTNKATAEAIRERLPELDEDLPPRDSHD
ncbi:methylglyoxal reductase (NADPH-dependent) gre2 [Ceratocystis pirilliformis]|uniref:Methylglyoxal reductase (NADPH-dependent) gre2 n=1 Tax=Ceratocystis pirilliformis TaxID=259994 RepID=A0ABR3YY18_9PEZI